MVAWFFLHVTSVIERNMEDLTHEGQTHKIIWNVKVFSMTERNIITLNGCDVLFILWRLISFYMRLNHFDCKSFYLLPQRGERKNCGGLKFTSRALLCNIFQSPFTWFTLVWYWIGRLNGNVGLSVAPWCALHPFSLFSWI